MLLKIRGPKCKDTFPQGLRKHRRTKFYQKKNLPRPDRSREIFLYFIFCIHHRSFLHRLAQPQIYDDSRDTLDFRVYWHLARMEALLSLIRMFRKSNFQKTFVVDLESLLGYRRCT